MFSLFWQTSNHRGSVFNDKFVRTRVGIIYGSLLCKKGRGSNRHANKSYKTKSFKCFELGFDEIARLVTAMPVHKRYVSVQMTRSTRQISCLNSLLHKCQKEKKTGTCKWSLAKMTYRTEASFLGVETNWMKRLHITDIKKHYSCKSCYTNGALYSIACCTNK